MTQRHYVTFASPGTLFPETREMEIDNWDVEAAVALARTVVERHNARPYSFRFSTRESFDQGFQTRQIARSKDYFLGGVLLTLQDIEARKDPKDDILIANMRNFGYDKVVENTNSWRATLPFQDGDVLLDVVL